MDGEDFLGQAHFEDVAGLAALDDAERTEDSEPAHGFAHGAGADAESASEPGHGAVELELAFEARMAEEIEIDGALGEGQAQARVEKVGELHPEEFEVEFCLFHDQILRVEWRTEKENREQRTEKPTAKQTTGKEKAQHPTRSRGVGTFRLTAKKKTKNLQTKSARPRVQTGKFGEKRRLPRKAAFITPRIHGTYRKCVQKEKRPDGIIGAQFFKGVAYQGRSFLVKPK